MSPFLECRNLTKAYKNFALGPFDRRHWLAGEFATSSAILGLLVGLFWLSVAWLKAGSGWASYLGGGLTTVLATLSLLPWPVVIGLGRDPRVALPSAPRASWEPLSFCCGFWACRSWATRFPAPGPSRWPWSATWSVLSWPGSGPSAGSRGETKKCSKPT